MSLDSGIQPEGIALAIIAPQLKPGGLTSKAEDQRPIALTTHQSKHFERIARQEITAHVENKTSTIQLSTRAIYYISTSNSL